MQRCSAILTLVVLAAACGDDETTTVASETQLLFSALVQPAADSDNDSELFMAWSVTSGSPDYLYAWGRATLGQNSFSLALDRRPPVEAVNGYGVGVGHVVAVAQAPDDGVVADERSLQAAVKGVTAQHAIIYVDRALVDAMTSEVMAGDDEALRSEWNEFWVFDFPPGYSCGEGVEHEPGKRFDTFRPVDCSRMQLMWGKLDELDVVNWT